MSMEDFRLDSGLPGSMTDWDYDLVGGSTTDCWLETVWKYCSEREISLHDNLPKLELMRVDDKFLMEAFIQAGCTASKLWILNLCRCFLMAITLTHICDAQGTQITQVAYDGNAFST